MHGFASFASSRRWLFETVAVRCTAVVQAALGKGGNAAGACVRVPALSPRCVARSSHRDRSRASMIGLGYVAVIPPRGRRFSPTIDCRMFAASSFELTVSTLSSLFGLDLKAVI